MYSIREIYKKSKHIFINQTYLKDDSIFRIKVDLLHHVYHTPLVQLPIDMLKIFNIVFIMHCVQLGVTKTSIKYIFIIR